MKFTELLEQAASKVSAYRQSIFKTLLIALCTGNCPGRISSIFRAFSSLLTGKANSKRFYKFLNSAKLPWEDLWRLLASQLGDPSLDGRILIALDDTSYGKTGKKIAGCARHFDHAHKKNSSAWIFGHCRVVAGILSYGHGRWACLPFAQKLYLPLPKTVKASAKLPHSAWLKTKSGIGAELVLKIISLFNRQTLLVCDSWFGGKPLLKEVREKSGFIVHLLTRLRVSAVLHAFPDAPSGKRGRRPKFGKRLPAVKALSTQLRQSARSSKIHLYGKVSEVIFSELICMSKALGCPVKIVFVYYKNFSFPILSTDLSLSAEQMVEFYSARWKIESGFKEIKHEIGAINSQCRKALAVENHFNLCCFATSLAWIYAFKLDHAPARLHPTKHSGPFAFADVRRKIANELSADAIFPGRCPDSLIPAVKAFCASLFRLAS